MRLRRKGQSTVEYAVLVIIIIGAFLAMQQYLKRGFQGRWKATMDDFGDQYDPRLVNSKVTYTLVSNSDTMVQAVPAIDPVTGASGFTTNRTDVSSSIENKQVNAAVGSFDASGNPIIPSALEGAP